MVMDGIKKGGGDTGYFLSYFLVYKLWRQIYIIWIVVTIYYKSTKFLYCD